MAEAGKTEDFGDEQLEELFSAFDGLSAPDSLKASTLGLIAALPTAAGAGGAAGEAAGEAAGQGASASSPAQGAGTAPADAPKVTATRGKRPRVKGRSIRAAAVAASLALVVTGGVAYATPTSIVTVAQGDSAIELGVNYFGTSVSAASDDEIGRTAVASSNLVHVPYGDALSRAANALDAAGASGSLELFVESADEGQRARLAGQNQVFLADRGEAEGVLSEQESPDGTPEGGQPSGQLGESGEPGGVVPDGAQAGAQVEGVSADGGQPDGAAASDRASGQVEAGASNAGSSGSWSSGSGASQPVSSGGGAGASGAELSWSVVREPKDDKGGSDAADGGECLALRTPETNECGGLDRRDLPSGFSYYLDRDRWGEYQGDQGDPGNWGDWGDWGDHQGDWTWTDGSGWWSDPQDPDPQDS